MGQAPGRDVWKKLVFLQRFARKKLVHLNLQLLYTLVTVLVLAAALALRGWLP